MPYQKPGSLTVDETYSVRAFVLFLNGIVGEKANLDEQVKMLHRNGFIPDPRPDVPSTKVTKQSWWTPDNGDRATGEERIGRCAHAGSTYHGYTSTISVLSPRKLKLGSHAGSAGTECISGNCCSIFNTAT